MGMEVARMNGVDTVASPDGSGNCCGSPSTQMTNQGSSDVMINGIGVVRLGDAMNVHPYAGPCCNPHSPILTSGSSTVFVNGKPIGRKGDPYGGDHIISSGSSTVFCG